MRLTLRTLLAYLDDVLPPSETREIGDKVRTSTVAQGLISRIKDVIRRRRLAAPEVNSPNAIDPNTMAAYLDDSLPDSAVTELEARCLEDDVALAEVAACHQIMSLAVTESLEVRDESLQRFYALGGATGPSSSKNGATPSRLPVSSPEAAISSPTQRSNRGSELLERPKPPATDQATAFRESLPDYLRTEEPFYRRHLAVVSIVGLIVASAALILADRDLWTGIGDRARDPAVADRGGRGAAARGTTGGPRGGNGGAVNPAAGGPSEVDPTATSSTDPAAGSSGAQAGDPVADAGQVANRLPQNSAVSPSGEPAVGPAATGAIPDGGSAPPQPIPADGTSGDPGADTVIVNAPPANGGNSVALANTPRPLPAPVPANAGAAVPAVTAVGERLADGLSLQYISTEGVLLREQPKDQHWYLVPRKSALMVGTEYACPEPFEGVVDIGTSQTRVSLLGGSRIRLRGAVASAAWGLELDRGRVVLLSPAVEGAIGRTLAVFVGDTIWQLELAGDLAAVGLEAIAPPAGPIDPRMSNPVRHVLVSVSSGQAKVTGPAGSTQTFNPGHVLELTAGGQFAVLADPQKPGSIPDWLDPQKRRMSSVMRHYAAMFEGEFIEGQPEDVTIAGIVKHPKPKLAELATLCLGLTDNYGALIQTLAESEHEETRRAAISGLREWLRTSPTHAADLANGLTRFFGRDEADAVYRLLFGLTPADARDRAKSLQAVEWLRSTEPVIRELAIQNLTALTGKRYDFHALGSNNQREAAIRKWYSHLDREGALVKLEPPAAEAK